MPLTLNNKQLALLATAGAGITVSALVLRYFLKRHSYWNSEFVEAGKVDELVIFPIKSCKGIKTEWLDCGERGPYYGANRDRFFLIVDAKTNHQFLTARTYPKMVLLASSVDDNNLLTLSTSTHGNITVDLNKVIERNDVRHASLHRQEKTDGLDCGDEVGDYLTNFLDVVGKRQLRLIYFKEGLHTERDFPSEPNYWNNYVPDVKDHIGYADLASYMACTKSSVDELNQRLIAESTVVSAANFRPNILVSGVPAFDEDKWLHVRIGETEFVCYKPCTRCVLTTVDPDAGKKNENMQPLKKLREYRLAPEGKLRDLYRDSPVFGVNMAISKPGRIHVGDKVFIRYKPTPY